MGVIVSVFVIVIVFNIAIVAASQHITYSFSYLTLPYHLPIFPFTHLPQQSSPSSESTVEPRMEFKVKESKASETTYCGETMALKSQDGPDDTSYFDFKCSESMVSEVHIQIFDSIKFCSLRAFGGL